MLIALLTLQISLLIYTKMLQHKVYPIAYCFELKLILFSTRLNPLVISKYGASEDYPGCTDLIHTKAI